jgi:hypothetical protein
MVHRSKAKQERHRKKNLKAPLSPQLRIDETPSYALNEDGCSVEFRELFRGRKIRRTKPLRIIGRKTAEGGGCDSGGHRERDGGRGFPRDRR